MAQDVHAPTGVNQRQTFMERLTVDKTWRYDHLSRGIDVAEFLVKGNCRKTLREFRGFVKLRRDDKNPAMVLVAPFSVRRFRHRDSCRRILCCRGLLLC